MFTLQTAQPRVLPARAAINQRVGSGNGTAVVCLMRSIEFIVDERSVAYSYDVNTNTNYNPRAEAEAGRSGMRAIAEYLAFELERDDGRRASAGYLSAAR